MMVVDFCEFHPGNSEEFKARAAKDNAGYDAIIYPPNENGFTPDVINASLQCQHKLKVVACPNDALSHLSAIADIAKQNDIALIKAHDIHPRPVAEYTLMQLLMHMRDIERLQNITGQKGAFPHQEAVSTTHSIEGKTIGVIGGSGKDGQGVIRLMKACGLNVVATAKDSQQDKIAMERAGAKVVSLTELLAQSDFISVNCRRDHSIGLLGKEQIAQMKKGAIIINPSGADIIDKTALFEQLRLPLGKRTIGKVILDMPYGGQRDEKAFMSDPDNAVLKDLGVVFTPRMAGSTIEARQEGNRQLIDIVSRILEGTYHASAQEHINPAEGAALKK